MEEIKTLIKDSFYTQPLMMASAFLAIVIGLFRWKHLKQYQILIIYPMASFLQALIAYVSFIYVTVGKWLQADLISENIFILVESLILYIFFNKIIFLRKAKLYMHIIFSMYILYFVSLWIFTNAFFLSANKIYLIESAVMLFFCLLYLFQLFKIPQSATLLQTLPFWMTIGCLFYFSSTIPLFVTDLIVGVHSNFYGLYSINFLAYAVLFLCTSKAFLCKPIVINAQ